MARGSQVRGNQGDLFAGTTPVYPVRRPAERVRPLDLSLRIKTAMGQALKDCPLNAGEVAAKMGAILGAEISADTLYTYTAASKPDHQISLVRFVAFVRATSAWWLYDLLVEDDGLIVMEGREARLAELGLLEQERQAIEKQIKVMKAELRHEPVKVAVHRRRRP